MSTGGCGWASSALAGAGLVTRLAIATRDCTVEYGEWRGGVRRREFCAPVSPFDCSLLVRLAPARHAAPAAAGDTRLQSLCCPLSACLAAAVPARVVVVVVVAQVCRPGSSSGCRSPSRGTSERATAPAPRASSRLRCPARAARCRTSPARPPKSDASPDSGSSLRRPQRASRPPCPRRQTVSTDHVPRAAFGRARPQKDRRRAIRLGILPRYARLSDSLPAPQTRR